MGFIIDFNENIREQWVEQSVVYSHTSATIDNTIPATKKAHKVKPTQIEVYNFPPQTGSIIVRNREVKKLNELFGFIKSKKSVTIIFREAQDLWASEEFKQFKAVQFDISPLTMDENKMYTDLKQLIKLKNMTIMSKIDLETKLFNHNPCKKTINLLKYMIVLKNGNCPAKLLFNENV